jgi:hypothetical protein
MCHDPFAVEWKNHYPNEPIQEKKRENCQHYKDPDVNGNEKGHQFVMHAMKVRKMVQTWITFLYC